jgi:hypothetical protein
MISEELLHNQIADLPHWSVKGSDLIDRNEVLRLITGRQQKDGLKLVQISEDVIVSAWGEPLCAQCKHPHTDGSWSDTDPDDGTCWSAGSLVCGCPKFITPAVQRLRLARKANHA